MVYRLLQGGLQIGIVVPQAFKNRSQYFKIESILIKAELFFEEKIKRFNSAVSIFLCGQSKSGR